MFLGHITMAVKLRFVRLGTVFAVHFQRVSLLHMPTHYPRTCRSNSNTNSVTQFVPVHQQRAIYSGAGTIFQQGGQAWCVTQPFPAGVLGGAISPPAGTGAEPRRQTHLGNYRLKINWKSGLFWGTEQLRRSPGRRHHRTGTYVLRQNEASQL